MSLQTFVTWLTITAWTDLLGWFGTAQQKVASFSYHFLKKSDQLVKSGALEDIIKLVPEIAGDVKTKDFTELFVDVKQLIDDILKIRDIVLDDTDITILTANTIAQAKDAAQGLETYQPAATPAAGA